MTEAQKNIIRRLLQPRGGIRMVMALLVLFAGTVLLLLSILAWSDFNELLNGGGSRQARSSYVVIGKLITDRNMTQANNFGTEEITDLISAPQVQDVGAVIPARFPVFATIGGGDMTMTTDLPVAAVPDRFIDSLPPNWKWQPGSSSLPVILSAQFLDVYNYVFAPGQGLPQLSRASVKAISLRLHAGDDKGVVLSGYVAGFTDRINTLLVPQSFVAYGNATYGADVLSGGSSQLILKVNDPSAPEFVTYLEAHGYTTAPQQLQWSRMRAAAEAIATGTGLLALLLMGVSALVFILFLELTIARAQTALLLLLQLGYSRAMLQKAILARFLPGIILTMVLAAGTCLTIQVLVAFSAAEAGLQLSFLPGWSYWTALLFCMVLLGLLLLRSVRKALSPQSFGLS